MQKNLISIRVAMTEDVPSILIFINEKADFDREIGSFDGLIQSSEENIRQVIFGDNPFVHVLLAESDGCPIGYALYYFCYSSFLGQSSIWLDDLYVRSVNRGQGAGKKLMMYLGWVATKNGCDYVAWNTDVRNDCGLSFYKNIGAEVLYQDGDECFFQWNSYLEPVLK
jgi:GNAT superfamily N-acetyltransferase